MKKKKAPVLHFYIIFVINLIFVNSLLISLIEDEILSNIVITYLYLFSINILILIFLLFIKNFLEKKKYSKFIFITFFYPQLFSCIFIKL